MPRASVSTFGTATPFPFVLVVRARLVARDTTGNDPFGRSTLPRILGPEASGRLVGPPVFKTGVGARAPRRVRFPSASAWREWGGIVESVRLLVSLLGGQGSVLLPVSGTVPRGGPRPLARSGRFEGSYTDMTERIIVPDAALDELEASRSFEAFYEAEARILFRRLWLVTGNRAEAEELMQDAFLKVWERWDRVGGVDDPIGYLYRTAMNLFRKRYRRAMLAVRRTAGLAPSNDDFSVADDRHVVRHVLATLPPRQRAALVLTEMLGFTAKEAGDALGVTDATIRSLTRHGRDAFRTVMEVDDA
jgi:RNA polymerase sigma-70 factor, ECF subfamily